MRRNREDEKGVRLLLSLGKASVSLPVSGTAVVGYFAAHGQINFTLWWVFSGVFILSSGASAMNQVQEHLTDALMIRTRYRPLPAGKMKRSTGLLLSLLMILTGSLILWAFTPFVSLVLALFTVFWYNGVYTPLKKITAFAVFPGALVGAIPPMIGYTAAGGEILAVGNIAVAFFFFMAQMPHFWIISLRSGEDYKRAGFPVVTDLFSDIQVRRLTMVWTSCTAISSLVLPMGGIFHDAVSLTVTVLAGASFLVLMARVLILKPSGKSLPQAFGLLNSYVLFFMLLIIGWSVFTM